MMTETFSIFGLLKLLVSRTYDCSSSTRTKIPFKDLQGVLNDQFHVISDLFTGIYLCLRILS